jgi:glycosyltransferase involved in cell wall biosynthesis
MLGRPDVLLVESPPLFLGLSGLWLSRVTGARLIFNVSDLWPESAVRLGLLSNDGVAHRLSTALEARCYRDAWLVTGQSRETVDDIVARFPRTRTLHLSNGVDTERFRPDRATPAARLALGRSADCVVFYAGLHGLAQGLDQVVDSAAAFRENTDVRFVFMGDGPEKPQLQERVRAARLAQVRFLDARPAAEMPAYLAAADIIVIALRTTLPGAVPSKLYEAMASGRPVVLVADGEAAEIVRTHDAGVTVRPGDIDGISHAIRELRSDPARRARLGANGRRAAERCFDRAHIASRFIDYLEAHVPPPAVGSTAARPAGSLTS